MPPCCIGLVNHIFLFALVSLLFIPLAMKPPSSLFGNAFAESCSIVVKEPNLTSTFDGRNTTHTPVKQFVVSTEVTHTNCSTNHQPFAAVIEIRNSAGITEYLNWQSGVLLSSTTDAVHIGLDWTPAHAGNYEIRTFVMKDFETPEILSPLMKKVVNVKNITDSGWTYSEADKPFTIILIPDTQNYWTTGNQEIAYNQSKWIVENKDKLNTRLVIHLGDIVNDWNSKNQWKEADNMMSILDDNDVPYIFLPGNHDFGNPYSSALSRNYTYYEKYFPYSRLMTRDQILETKEITPDSANWYTLLKIGNNDFLILAMEYCPTLDVIKQVNETIKQHADTPVILATHAFLRGDGSWTSISGGGVCTKIAQSEGYSTKAIWDLVVYPNPNVFLVVSGHSGGDNKRIDQNIEKKPVLQVVIDYQHLKNGGDGMLKIVRFDPSKDQIHFQTYSPWLDSYASGTRSDFSFDYDMN